MFKTSGFAFKHPVRDMNILSKFDYGSWNFNLQCYLFPGYESESDASSVPATVCKMGEKEVCETVEKTVPKEVANNFCETVSVEKCGPVAV